MNCNPESLRVLKHWMVERENIRLKREAGLPAPWTEDKILRDYKFCNVRREDDKNSKWLIKNIAENSTLSLVNKVTNIICARMYNNLTTMEEYFPVEYDEKDYRQNWDFVDSRLKNTRYLCNAYMPVNHQYAAGYFATKTGLENGLTPSGKLAYYRPSNLMRLGEEFVRDGVVDMIISISLENIRPYGDGEHRVFDVLRGLPSMGDFMAYQHFVDLTYITELCLDENELVISGPGTVMGLQLLYAEKLHDTYRRSNNTPDLSFKLLIPDFDPDIMLYELRENFYDWFPEWPFEWTPTVMCLENCFCEFHKYMKALKGWGTPRNKYDGKVQTPSLFD